MNNAGKILVVIALITTVAGVVAFKQKNNKKRNTIITQTAITQSDIEPENTSLKTDRKDNLPKLVDLGAGKCMQCKMMAPILEELKKEYQGRLDVTFIDVWENPDEAKKYGVKMIPTQIFYDSSGKELFRHESFFSKQDILDKWTELGIDIEKEQ